MSIKKDNVATFDKLHLKTMKQVYIEQATDPTMDNCPFDQRLSLMLTPEWSDKCDRKRTRLIRRATLDQPTASIEDIIYNTDRQLKKNEILNISSCEFINNSDDIIIIGDPGAGKTYLSNALAMEAINRLILVKYYRLPDLLLECAIAEKSNNYDKLKIKLAKYQLLVIDEWLVHDTSLRKQSFIHDIISLRHKRSSTIVCSPFDFDLWTTKFKYSSYAPSIIDRLQNSRYIIRIKGNKSMRSYKI